MKRIKILDSMRGLAATVVVFHHVYTRFFYLFAGKEPAFVHSILNFISELNVEAVMFFFLLSGFSIRLSLHKGLPITKELVNEYLYRRFKRILPLYYTAILFTFLAGLLTGSVYSNRDFSFNNLLGNIFFLQSSHSYKGNWFAPYGDNGPLWSLSFEMFYYLLFPVFIFLLLKIVKANTLTEKTNRAALFFSFLISLVCIIINSKIFFPYIAFAALFYTWYCGFFLGDLYKEKRVTVNIDLMLIIAFTITAGILLYLQPSASLYKLFCVSIMAFLFFLIYFTRKKYYHFFTRYPERIFNFIFYQLGKGSYAIYLLHYPFVMILKNCFHANLAMVITGMGVFIATCIWLEQFFVKLKWGFLKIRYLR